MGSLGFDFGAALRLIPVLLLYIYMSGRDIIGYALNI